MHSETYMHRLLTRRDSSVFFSTSFRATRRVTALVGCIAVLCGGCQTTGGNGATGGGGAGAGPDARTARVEQLESELAAAVHANEALRAENHALRVRAERATAARDEIQRLLEQRASESLKRPDVSISPLSAGLDAALADFARQSGGQVAYDRDHAGLLFSGDLLFERNSDEARSELRRLLESLAAIVASHSEPVDLFICGHPEDAPVRQPETLEKHPTAWHLAVHRAIAVKDALVASGIGENRVTIGAKHAPRPDGAGGRRVDVFFVRKGEFSVSGSIQ